jgi:hypothetical protein
MRRCRTCGTHLWMVWLIFALPWTKRVRKFKDAEDCIHLMAADWDKDDASDQT